MINYKKSLLSFATILALSATSVSADYVPLTNTGTDNVWSLFGVNGFKSDGGVVGTVAGIFSIEDSIANAVTDDGGDDLYTAGFIQVEALAKVKKLTATGSVEVRIDTAGIIYEETDPERTIYVALDEDDASPNFAIKYKASLEGQRVEYSIADDGSDAHFFILDSVNTYNNPVIAQVIPDAEGEEGSLLSAVADVVDYDFAGNPPSVSYYDKATDQQEAGDVNGANIETIRLYSYDANNLEWNLYDSGNTAAANDFTALEKAKAYWGKIDDAGNAKEAGLVLGSSVLTTADYLAAGITDGWNLISFDSTYPDLRVATTGLIVQLTGAGNITLTDSSNNHDVIAAVDNTDAIASCRAINVAIKSAKTAGNIPDIFHLKALPVDATHIALVSNKRFLLKDTGTVLGTGVTLAGNDPIDPATLEPDAAIAADVPLAGAQSVYGEYAMIIDALTGPGTAQNLTNSSSLDTKRIVEPVVANVQVAIGANPGATATAITTADANLVTNLVDLNYDGTADKILIAATDPFYIRDHTFSRVFTYTADAVNNGTVTLTTTGAATATATITAGDLIGAAATAIDGTAGVSAIEDATEIIIVNDQANGNEFTVTEALTADNLEDATTTSDYAKGAVSGVYSLNDIAIRALENTATIDIDTVPDEVGDIVDIDLNGVVDVATGLLTAAEDYSVDATTEAAFFDDTVTVIRELLASNYIVATVSHDYATAGSVAATLITIVGPDITAATAVLTPVSTANPTQTVVAPVLGDIAEITADLTRDLKYNAVYTPNYVIDGPLYTMKEAGFTAKAMVTGTMNFSSGDISWESIDLTRKPSEWLDSQDYNLFNIDDTSGYWTYLETDGAGNTLAVANPDLNPLVYTHRFNVDGSTYNSVSGNLEIEVQNLDDYDDRDSARVSAYIAGTNIELVRASDTDNYSGKLSSYELKEMEAGSDYEVFVNVADGMGYNLIKENTDIVVDYKKPEAPSIDFGDGVTVAFASTSVDTAGYYVFNGQVPENGTASAGNLLAALTVEEAGAYALCGELDALTFADDEYQLNVFAVDGKGTLGTGNASDMTVKSYVPMLKSAILMSDTNNGESDAALTGTVYDDTCADEGAQTANYGVTLTSETDLETVKLAFNHKDGADLTAVPLTVFLNTGANTTTAKITYPSIYEGDRVYVEVDDVVYAFELPTAVSLDGTVDSGTSTATASDLTGVKGNLQDDQSL